MTMPRYNDCTSNSNRKCLNFIFTCSYLNLFMLFFYIFCRTPKFAFGLAHDLGTIWAMDWCPSGACDISSQTAVHRLGLLAVASSNGSAYVFSVPYPSMTENLWVFLFLTRFWPNIIAMIIVTIHSVVKKLVIKKNNSNETIFLICFYTNRRFGSFTYPMLMVDQRNRF